jgi:hypothetical protein
MGTNETGRTGKTIPILMIYDPQEEHTWKQVVRYLQYLRATDEVWEEDVRHNRATYSFGVHKFELGDDVAYKTASSTKVWKCSQINR